MYALEQRHAVETGTLPADIRAEVEKVEWCDLLILSFPMYGFSLPAILKGWIDRVFVCGRFYGGKRIYDRGGMRGKRALAALSLGGRTHMFGREGIHGEMNLMLCPLLQGTLAYAGFTVLPPFVAYHVPYISDEARQAILAQYRDTLLALDALVPLDFPRLADYDDTLRPKVNLPRPTVKTRLAEAPAFITKDGSEIRVLLQPDLHGNRNQSLAEATVPPGIRTLLHRHPVTEEIYHVTAGEGLMTLGSTSFEVGVGDSILIPPGTPHCIEGRGVLPLRFLCCCSPAYSHEDTELLDAQE